ncbi:MAG: SDR family NAD(P)-dependent oxidoreductase [Pseudomonadota bacterium]
MENTNVYLPDASNGKAPSQNRLEGKRLLIVGAGQQDYKLDDEEPPVGNGRAMSVLFAREGALLVCADRNERNLDITLSQIDEEGFNAHDIIVDVSEPEAIERLVVDAVDKLGGLDGLVCNVGIGGPLGLAATDADSWDEVLNVNLRSHMLLCREALPHLPVGGSIVLISSVAGIKPGSRNVSYDASKSGLQGLMKHVALEGSRQGVRANVVAPGLIDTPLGRSATRGRPSRAKAPVPLGRQGTAWEVAYTTLFLMSDESAYVSGQTLVVDGGLSALR